MLNFNEYLDLIKKVRMEEIMENGKEASSDNVLNFIDKISNMSKVESKFKTEAVLCFDDFSDAYEDMKDPEIYSKIMILLNEKLAKDGDAFDINTPENQMLGLANRYVINALECKKMRKWTSFAFYMRSLAYFIPILMERAQMEEEKVLKKVESAASPFDNPALKGADVFNYKGFNIAEWPTGSYLQNIKIELKDGSLVGGFKNIRDAKQYIDSGKANKISSEYGDKRDYPKIDIYVDGKYVATTTWAKTCKEAAEKYKEKHPEAKNVQAHRAHTSCVRSSFEPEDIETFRSKWDSLDDTTKKNLILKVAMGDSELYRALRDGLYEELSCTTADKYGDELDDKYILDPDWDEYEINGEMGCETTEDFKEYPIISARDVSYKELVDEIDEKVGIVKNNLDRINSRFRYRMLTNVSYPLEKANQIEEDLWKELTSIDKNVNSLWNKIG